MSSRAAAAKIVSWITGQLQEVVLCLTLTLGLAFSVAAQTTEPFEVRRTEAAFEELPVLNASEILRPEFLAGPHHKVREPVPTSFGANQFTIDSDFGVFEANGNEMLVRRINEINAIAQLNDVSRTDEYKMRLSRLQRAQSPQRRTSLMIRSTPFRMCRKAS
jgi:hypothetical protein